MSLVSLIGFPLSIDSNTAKKRECFCINLARAYKYFDLWKGLRDDHCFWALLAELTARSTSFFVLIVKLNNFLLVAGLITLIFFDPLDVYHFPLI